MNIKNMIINLFDNIKIWFQNLTSKKKLFVLILVLIVLVMLVKSMKNHNENINYKNLDISTEYILGEKISDNNLYVTLINISKDFFTKTDKYDKNEKITTNKIYNDIIDESYKKCISNRKFKEKYSNLSQAIREKNVNSSLYVPNNIVSCGDNKYLLNFSLNDKSEIYVGIKLDIKSNKYYIWYLG